MSDSYLAKFNPQISVFSQFEIAPDLPKEEKAFETWKALVSARKNHDGLFLVIGKLLKAVRDESLYLSLDYENFSQFLESEELGFSREKAYMCIKTYEFYVEAMKLDPEKIGHMNVSRLSMMVPMLKKLGDDKEEVVKQIEEMNSLRHGDFVREVKKNTNKDGRPTVFWSEALGKWMIQYFSNTSFLQDVGEFNRVIDGEVVPTV